MSRATLFLLCTWFSQNLLAASQVVGYLDDSIELLDDKGKVQRVVPSAELSQTLPVLRYDKELDLIEIELNDQKIWLDSTAVRIEPPLYQVNLPCEKLSSNYPEDQKKNVTIGFGAGCKK